jgi:hypothetical protein
MEEVTELQELSPQVTRVVVPDASADSDPSAWFLSDSDCAKVNENSPSLSVMVAKRLSGEKTSARPIGS